MALPEVLLLINNILMALDLLGRVRKPGAEGTQARLAIPQVMEGLLDHARFCRDVSEKLSELRPYASWCEAIRRKNRLTLNDRQQASEFQYLVRRGFVLYLGPELPQKRLTGRSVQAAGERVPARMEAAVERLRKNYPRLLDLLEGFIAAFGSGIDCDSPILNIKRETRTCVDQMRELDDCARRSGEDLMSILVFLNEELVRTFHGGEND